MNEWIKQMALSLWGEFVYYVTLQFVDPFWWGLAVVVVAVVAITAGMGLVSFYFGLPSWLRKLGGAIVFGMIAALTIFRIGENAARAHDAKKPKPKPADEQPSRPWIKMPWEP